MATSPIDQFGKPTGFGQGSPFTQTPKPAQGAVSETTGPNLPARQPAPAGTPSTSVCKQFCSGQIQFFRDPGCDCSQFAAEPIAQTPQGVPQAVSDTQQAAPPPATGGFNFQVPKGPSTAAPPAFVPGEFEVPEQRQATSDLISRLLSEEALSPSVVAQLKESQKSTILGGAQQLRQQFLQDAASRGVSRGGRAGAGVRDIAFRSLGDVSKSFRDIDIERARSGRADQLAAVQASRGFQQDLLNEFLRKEELKFAGSESALQRFLSTEGLGLDFAALGLQERQFLTDADLRKIELQDRLTR